MHRRDYDLASPRARAALRFPIGLALALTAFASQAGDLCSAGDKPTFAVSNSGFSDYQINGVGDPTLTVVRGCSYTFNVNASGHPFLLKTVQGSGTGNQVSDGVVGNGAQVGSITWTVAASAPSTLFYNCQFHSAMTGTINVIDSPLLFADGFED